MFDFIEMDSSGAELQKIAIENAKNCVDCWSWQCVTLLQEWRNTTLIVQSVQVEFRASWLRDHFAESFW